MAQGAQNGHLALINGTKYQWRRASDRSWIFPEDIAPFSTARVSLNPIFHTASADHTADIRYVMDQAGGRSFKIQLRLSHILVLIENFTVLGREKGSVIDLDWYYDSTMIFVLAGRVDEHSKDEFFSTGSDMSNWMKSQMDIIGDMTLRQLCLGGAHDAGMSVDQSSNPLVSNLVVTQTRSVRDQLMVGARYFDIQPVIGGGDYFTGNYGYMEILVYKGIQGARGQSIQEVVDQLNDFTGKYSGELIILSLSHSFNSDYGKDDYCPLNTREWAGLIRRLKGINNLFISQDSKVDLTTIQMMKFFEKGTSVVVVVIDKDEKVQLNDDAGKGFFMYPDSFPIFDDDANTYDMDLMKKDQFDKMSQPANLENKLFLLSWTCTPLAPTLDNMLLGIDGESVLNIAYTANQSLCDIFQCSTRQSFPNIILTDRFESTNETAIAIAINNRNYSQ